MSSLTCSSQAAGSVVSVDLSVMEGKPGTSQVIENLDGAQITLSVADCCFHQSRQSPRDASGRSYSNSFNFAFALATHRLPAQGCCGEGVHTLVSTSTCRSEEKMSC